MSFHITHCQAPLAALLKEIGPKPADVRHIIRKIRLAFSLHSVAQVHRDNLLDDLVHPILSRERTFDSNQLLIDSKNNRRPDLQVNVRCAAFDRGLEDTMKYFHAARPYQKRRLEQKQKAE